jgi:hypothetical protein
MALGTAGFTAALAIHKMEHNGQAPARGPVVVTGATGGVGSSRSTCSPGRGYEVIAVSGKQASVEWLKSLGASQVLLREGLDYGKRPLEAARFGGAIDNVGGEMLAWLTRTVDTWGNIASIGLAGGAELHTTVMPFILRGINLIGINSAAQLRDTRLVVWNRIATDLAPRHLARIASRTIGFDQLAGRLRRLSRGRGHRSHRRADLRRVTRGRPRCARSQPVQAELARTRTQAATLERLQLLAAFTQMFRALRDPVRVAAAASAARLAARCRSARACRAPRSSSSPRAAAFCLGALLHAAPVAVDAALAPALAAADHAARRAHYEGREPPTLRTRRWRTTRAGARLRVQRTRERPSVRDARRWRLRDAALLRRRERGSSLPCRHRRRRPRRRLTPPAPLSSTSPTPAVRHRSLRGLTAGLGTAHRQSRRCRTRPASEAACALRHALAALTGRVGGERASLRMRSPRPTGAARRPGATTRAVAVAAGRAGQSSRPGRGRGAVPGPLRAGRARRARRCRVTARVMPVDALLARLVRN